MEISEKVLNIKIIDDSGIEDLLHFEYRNKGIEINFQLFKNYIEELFFAEFQRVAALFKEKVISLSVRLEQNSPIANNNTHVKLASFNGYVSSANNLFFSLYYESLKSIFKSFQNKISFEAVKYSSTILHEIIHAADLVAIKEVIKNHQKSLKSNDQIRIKAANFSFYPIEEEPVDYDVQWTLLHYLDTYRTEGIAIIGEKIFHHKKFSYKKLNEDQIFRQDLNIVLKEVSQFKFFNRIQNKRSLELIQKLKLRSYDISDLILFKLISKKFDEFKSFDSLTDYINYLEKTADLSLNIKLLKYLIHFDLSDFIQSLLSYRTSNNKVLIDQEEFYKYCFILQNEENQKGLSDFIQLVNQSSFHFDEKLFLDTMKSTVFSVMPKKEIIKLFGDFKRLDIGGSREDIYQEIIVLGERLIEKFDKNEKIVSWALTYLLDDEDLVHDNLNYVGLQDDWFVLNAATHLTSIK